MGKRARGRPAGRTPPKKIVTMRLDAKLVEALDRAATESRRTRTSQVEVILDAWLSRERRPK